MPTCIGMSGRRIVFTLVVAFSQLCALTAAAATPNGTGPATTTTVPATTTTTKPPPPPAFGLPTDFGLQPLPAQAKAKVDPVAAQAKLRPAIRAAEQAKHDRVLRQRQRTQWT